MSNTALELQNRELLETIHTLNQTIQELRASLEASAQRESNLQEQIDYLTKKLFGKSSEKTKQAEGQLNLFNEAEIEADSTVPAPVLETKVREHIRKKKTTYEEKLCGIPVKEILVDVPEESRICPECGSVTVPIGKEVIRTEIEYIPAKVQAIQYVAVHYGCPECKKRGDTTILKPEIQPGLMNHSLASPSSVAWVMYQKYCNGLPLYRQEKDWEQYGLKISRTTMANWIVECSTRYFEPLYNLLYRKLLERQFLMADETRVQVLKEPNRSPETNSFMWLFRSGEDGLPPILLFHYSQTRSGENAESFLRGFKGYLECDAYGGYNNLPNVKRCACFAHIRRYFVDAIPAGKEEDLSIPAVKGVLFCDKLFAVEREAKEKELSFEARHDLRQKKAKPIVDSFVQWLKEQNPLPGSRFDKAVKYTLKQENFLYTYLEDGRCSLSNNLSENAIRPFTVGRKNWLFSDSVKGAVASSVVYSLVEMAKANDLNVFRYLFYLLSKLPACGTSDKDLEQLVPWSQKVKDYCQNAQ